MFTVSWLNCYATLQLLELSQFTCICIINVLQCQISTDAVSLLYMLSQPCCLMMHLTCHHTFVWFFNCIHLSGAVCIPIFLPLTVLFLICLSRSPEASLFQWPPPLPSADQLWDPLAPVLLLGWFALHAVIYLMPLGKVRHVHQPNSMWNLQWNLLWVCDLAYVYNEAVNIAL